MTLGDREKILREQGDNYKQMVLALRGLANEILFDDSKRSPAVGGVVRCGRKMTTSPENRHEPETDVTPDLVVQLPTQHGTVVECKWGTKRDEHTFERQVAKLIVQLEKYDDDLTGWPLSAKGDGDLKNHDVVLLVNHEDSRKLARVLTTAQSENRLSIRRGFAVVGAGQIQRTNGIWLELDLEAGSLRDERKTNKLRDRVQINPSKLAHNAEVALVELADCPPPVPVMLDLIQRKIIGNFDKDEYEQFRFEGEVRKPVSLDQISEWMSSCGFRQSDRRDAECPRREWIVEGMTALIEMKWVEKSPATTGYQWVYIHKKGRRSPYEHFIRFCAKRALKSETADRKMKAREAAQLTRKQQREISRTAGQQEHADAKRKEQLELEVKSHPLIPDYIRKFGELPQKRTGKKR